MPQAQLVSTPGDTVPYTASGVLAAGDVVVQSELVGVTTRPLASGETGSLAVSGIFAFTKPGVTAYAAGILLYWDDTANATTTTATGNKLIGKVSTAAASTDTTVNVRLSQ